MLSLSASLTIADMTPRKLYNNGLTSLFIIDTYDILATPALRAVGSSSTTCDIEQVCEFCITDNARDIYSA